MPAHCSRNWRTPSSLFRSIGCTAASTGGTPVSDLSGRLSQVSSKNFSKASRMRSLDLGLFRRIHAERSSTRKTDRKIGPGHAIAMLCTMTGPRAWRNSASTGSRFCLQVLRSTSMPLVNVRAAPRCCFFRRHGKVTPAFPAPGPSASGPRRRPRRR